MLKTIGGALSRHFARILSSSAGTSGLARDAGGGWSLRIEPRTSDRVGPLNACRPVSISYSTVPKEKMSER